MGEENHIARQTTSNPVTSQQQQRLRQAPVSSSSWPSQSNAAKAPVTAAIQQPQVFHHLHHQHNHHHQPQPQQQKKAHPPAQLPLQRTPKRPGTLGPPSINTSPGPPSKRPRKSNEDSAKMLEEATKLWWLIHNGVPTHSQLNIRAFEYARTFGVKEGVTHEWCAKLMAKWGWAASGEEAPTEGELNGMADEEEFQMSDTFFVEEFVLLPRLMPTGLCKAPPPHNLNQSNASAADPSQDGSGIPPEQATDKLVIIFCVNGDGTERLPPMALGTTPITQTATAAAQKAGVVYQLGTRSRLEPLCFSEWLNAFRTHVHLRSSPAGGERRVRLVLRRSVEHRVALSWAKPTVSTRPIGVTRDMGQTTISLGPPRQVDVRLGTDPRRNPFENGIRREFLRLYRRLYLRSLISQQKQAMAMGHRPPVSLRWEEVLVLVGHVWYNELSNPTVSKAFTSLSHRGGLPEKTIEEALPSEYVAQMNEFMARTPSTITLENYTKMDESVKAEVGIRESEIVEVVMRRRTSAASLVPGSSSGAIPAQHQAHAAHGPGQVQGHTAIMAQQPKGRDGTRLATNDLTGKPLASRRVSANQSMVMVNQPSPRTVGRASSSAHHPSPVPQPEVSVFEAKKALDNLILFCSQHAKATAPNPTFSSPRHDAMPSVSSAETAEGMARHLALFVKFRTRLDEMAMLEMLD